MEPKGLLTRILEGAILLALSAWLIKAAVRWLVDVWPVLVILAVIALAGIIFWRIYKHWRNTGQW